MISERLKTELAEKTDEALGIMADEPCEEVRCHVTTLELEGEVVEVQVLVTSDEDDFIGEEA